MTTKCPECEEPIEMCLCFDENDYEDDDPLCMECGEPNPALLHEHPDFEQDHMCKDCLIAYWEEHVEYAQEELRKAKEMK